MKIKQLLENERLVSGSFVVKVFIYGMITGAVLMFLFSVLGIVG